MNKRLSQQARDALIVHAGDLEAYGDRALSTALTMLLEWYAAACAAEGCPACKGLGIIETPMRVKSRSSSEIIMHGRIMKCQACGGSGRRPSTEATHVDG